MQQLQRRIERFLLRGHHDASLPNDAPILDGPQRACQRLDPEVASR
ncbi:MAG: hypothetical protein IE917_18305 [Betaproteobacteria bacterium]|nr:hypothetical protein [Betaproteobacteria bacterium]